MKPVEATIYKSMKILEHPINAKRPSPRHIILKLSKVSNKERILKAVRGKKIVTWEDNPIRLSETSQQKFYRPGENKMTYSKYWKIKTDL